jgi:hypothetical protein
MNSIDKDIFYLTSMGFGRGRGCSFGLITPSEEECYEIKISTSSTNKRAIKITKITRQGRGINIFYTWLDTLIPVQNPLTGKQFNEREPVQLPCAGGAGQMQLREEYRSPPPQSPKRKPSVELESPLGQLYSPKNPRIEEGPPTRDLSGPRILFPESTPRPSRTPRSAPAPGPTPASGPTPRPSRTPEQAQTPASEKKGGYEYMKVGIEFNINYDGKSGKLKIINIGPTNTVVYSLVIDGKNSRVDIKESGLGQDKTITYKLEETPKETEGISKSRLHRFLEKYGDESQIEALKAAATPVINVFDSIGKPVSYDDLLKLEIGHVYKVKYQRPLAKAVEVKFIVIERKHWDDGCNDATCREKFIFISTKGAPALSDLDTGVYPVSILTDGKYGDISETGNVVHFDPGDIQELMDTLPEAREGSPRVLNNIFDNILAAPFPAASPPGAVNINIGIGEWYTNGTGEPYVGPTPINPNKDKELKWLLCLREMQKFDQIKDFITTSSSKSNFGFGARGGEFQKLKEIEGKIVEAKRNGTFEKAHYKQPLRDIGWTEEDISEYLDGHGKKKFNAPTPAEKNEQLRVIFQENLDVAIPHIVKMYYPSSTGVDPIQKFTELFTKDASGNPDIYGTKLCDIIKTEQNWKTSSLGSRLAPNKVIKYFGTLMGTEEITLKQLDDAITQSYFTASVLNFISKGEDVSVIPQTDDPDFELTKLFRSKVKVDNHTVYVDALSGKGSLGSLGPSYQTLANAGKLSTITSGIDILDGASTENIISTYIKSKLGAGNVKDYTAEDIHIEVKGPDGEPMIEFTIKYQPSANGDYDIFVKKYFELDCSDFISVRENKEVSKAAAWHTIKATEVLGEPPSSRKRQKDICFKSQKSLMDLSKIILAEYDIGQKGNRVGTTFIANDTCAAYSSAFITGTGTNNKSTPGILIGTDPTDDLVKPIKIVMKKRLATLLGLNSVRHVQTYAAVVSEGAEPGTSGGAGPAPMNFGKRRTKKLVEKVYKDIVYLQGL